MRLSEVFQGGLTPFEGNLTLWLRALPSGARATTATVTCAPVASPGGKPFEETFVFANGTSAPSPDSGELAAAAWGVTATNGKRSFAEVDFHARRTLAAVNASTSPPGHATARLQVDLGGMYVEISTTGAVMTPNGQPFLVTCDGTDQALPGLTVSKFKLTLETGALSVNKATVRSVPANISVRLGQMPPFWARPGELAAPSTSSDFASVLNAFLTNAETRNGYYQIPLVIHSDTIARLDVTLAVDYVVEQAVLPPHLPQVKLAYDFGTVPGAGQSLTTVSLPRAAVPVSGRTTARIRGTFQSTRIAQGPINDEPVTFPVSVSQDCALAQALRADREIAVTGIDLPLSQTPPPEAQIAATGVALPRAAAELQQVLTDLAVAIRADADGKPFGDVLASAKVAAVKLLPGQSVWGSATLPTPFRVFPGTRYWLVLQSVNGQASWNAAMASGSELPLVCSRDGGLSWRTATSPRTFAPLAALFRLRTTPAAFSVPVQLQIGTSPSSVRRQLDDYSPLGRVDFSFDFADKLAEYLTQQAPASPCGKDELLANAVFDQPPHTDATRRIFGQMPPVISKPNRTATITGTVSLRRGVDLSVERYIALVADSPRPVIIDCAGPIPAQTRLADIVTAINRHTPQTTVVAAITSQVYVQLAAKTSIRLDLWCRQQVPAGWTGTKGDVYRIKVPQTDGSERLAVVLAQSGALKGGVNVDGVSFSKECFEAAASSRQSALNPGGVETGKQGSTEIFQRIPVSGGCRYRLALAYLAGNATGPVAGINPSWEIVWLDGSSVVVATDGGALGFSPYTVASTTVVSTAEQCVTAPPTAQIAELHIEHSWSDVYPLVIEAVSFTPMLQLLCNSAFHQWTFDPLGDSKNTMQQTGFLAALATLDSGIPGDWSLTGGTVYWAPVGLNGWFGSGAILLGNGPDDTILSQTVNVNAGESYELRVRAQALLTQPDDVAAAPPQQRPRLELQWQGSGPPSDSTLIPLDDLSFPTHTWSGIAPAGATQADVRLIQPRGTGALLIESVSMRPKGIITVPLVFLAETPGELTVSDLRVAYTVAEPAPEFPLSMPAALSKQLLLARLAAPTSTPQPNETLGGTLTAPDEAPSPPSGDTPGPPEAVPQMELPLERSAGGVPPSVGEGAAPSRLLLITGISASRAQALTEAGIDSLEKLAIAQPERVVRVLRNVSMAQASSFIAAAKQQSAVGEGAASPTMRNNMAR